MDEQNPDPAKQPDPADDAFVRALLAEVGREPEPLPDDVAARLDGALAGLVQHRQAELDTETHRAVVPLDRARQRRRRGLQALVAAAAVVVGGYTVTTTGLLTTGGTGDDAGSATSATRDSSDAGVAGGGAEAPQLADTDEFPMASGSLRSDARRLVTADQATVSLRTRSPSATKDTNEYGLDGQTTRSPQAGAEADSAGSTDDLGALPKPQDSSTCLDPLVPSRLPRFAVTYDGRSATAVLRPLRDASDGAGRVRVEVWDCAAPVRLAAVVVRR